MDKVRIKLIIPFFVLLIVFYRKMKFYDGRTKSTTNEIVNFNLTVLFLFTLLFLCLVGKQNYKILVFGMTSRWLETSYIWI